MLYLLISRALTLIYTKEGKRFQKNKKFYKRFCPNFTAL